MKYVANQEMLFRYAFSSLGEIELRKDYMALIHEVEEDMVSLYVTTWRSSWFFLEVRGSQF